MDQDLLKMNEKYDKKLEETEKRCKKIEENVALLLNKYDEHDERLVKVEIEVNDVRDLIQTYQSEILKNITEMIQK